MLLTTVFIIRLFWLQLNLVCVINLGPSFDHTTKTTKGWYLYIEASAPRVPREFARINYRFPSPSTAGCFSMHFHMYGSQLGVLRVDLTTTDHKTFVAWRNNRFATADRWLRTEMHCTDLKFHRFSTQLHFFSMFLKIFFYRFLP